MSPRTAETAAMVDARIAEVTVFSDRARVRRRGRATGKAGVEIVRFPSLPGAVFLDTVRVAASGGRVLRVEATPVERERTSIAQAAKLLDALDAVDDRLVEIEDRRMAEDWEVGFLRALRPAAPVPEDKREGRKNLVVDAPSGGRRWTSSGCARAAPATACSRSTATSGRRARSAIGSSRTCRR